MNTVNRKTHFDWVSDDYDNPADDFAKIAKEFCKAVDTGDTSMLSGIYDSHDLSDIPKKEVKATRERMVALSKKLGHFGCKKCTLEHLDRALSYSHRKKDYIYDYTELNFHAEGDVFYRIKHDNIRIDIRDLGIWIRKGTVYYDEVDKPFIDICLMGEFSPTEHEKLKCENALSFRVDTGLEDLTDIVRHFIKGLPIDIDDSELNNLECLICFDYITKEEEKKEHGTEV